MTTNNTPTTTATKATANKALAKATAATAKAKTAPKVASSYAEMPVTVSTPDIGYKKPKTEQQHVAMLLNMASTMGAKVSGIKFAVAIAVFAKDINTQCDTALACKLYGVENKKGAAGYEKARGFHKDYLKPVHKAAQYLGPVFQAIREIDFTQGFDKVAADILALDIYGELPAPQTKGQWIDFINEYLPKEDKQTNPDGRKSKAAKGKGGDDSAVNEANTNVNNAVVEAIAAAAQDHKAYVNGYLNQLDAAGLPKAHRAKVAKVMLAMLDDYKTSIEKAATK